MHILAADDEHILLDALVDAIRESMPDAEIHGFSKPSELLAFAADTCCDIAFLDIRMRGIDGMELAARLKQRNPFINIIFVTGYEQYAADAMRLHASGYITKPVTKEKIDAEIADLRYPAQSTEPIRLRAQCFGYFELFCEDEPLMFSRSHTKELLAYLIDRKGGACTAGEIITALWENETDMSRSKNYLRVITNDLRNTLREKQLEQVLIRAHNQWAIRRELIDCDYYRMLKGDSEATEAWHGEYMTQYSWAEATAATLKYAIDGILPQVPASKDA